MTLKLLLYNTNCVVLEIKFMRCCLTMSQFTKKKVRNIFLKREIVMSNVHHRPCKNKGSQNKKMMDIRVNQNFI